jgi:exonuclease VII large subunit
LSILTRREIDDLYGLPRFTEEDQQLYFDLSAAEEARVRAMHTDSAKVHFVLQLGYFKAKRQFFVYACNEVQEDLRHILERHFPGRALATIRELSKPTRLEQQQVILNLFNSKRCGKAAKQDLERKAGRIAMRSTQPVYILREVLQYLAARRIVAPGYTILQDLVSRVVTDRTSTHHPFARASNYPGRPEAIASLARIRRGALSAYDPETRAQRF